MAALRVLRLTFVPLVVCFLLRRRDELSPRSTAVQLANSAPVLACADFCTAGAAGEFGGILRRESRAAAADAD